MHVHVQIDEPERVDLIKGQLCSVKQRADLFDWYCDEIQTPKGLPLTIWVQVDRASDCGSIEIKSGTTLLLQAGPLRAAFQTILLLPTEEQLGVAILNA